MPRSVLLSVLFAAGCHSSPIITVTLSNASFATTGGNLFNCSTPASPASQQSLSTGGIECDPRFVSKGVYSPTPVTATYQLGCAYRTGAVLVASCAASDGGTPNAFSGYIALGLNANCSSETDGGLPGNAQVFAFSELAPGTSQTQALSTCADYDNVCPTSNPCAFSALSATVTVTNKLP